VGGAFPVREVAIEGVGGDDGNEQKFGNVKGWGEGSLGRDERVGTGGWEKE